MEINALVMDLLRQSVQEGNIVVGSGEIDLDTIDPEHTVLIKLAFHVDVLVDGTRRPHGDGVRVEVLEMEEIDLPLSPEQFPDGFEIKGVG